MSSLPRSARFFTTRLHCRSCRLTSPFLNPHIVPLRPLSSSPTSSSTSSPDPSSTSSSSSSSSSTGPTSSSSSSGRSFFSFVKEELGHLHAFMNKNKAAQAVDKKRRPVSSVLNDPSPFQPVPEPLVSPPSDETTGKEEKDNGAEQSSALILIDSDTVWDKRMERMRRAFTSSAPFLTFRKAKRTLVHSENPILQPLHAIKGHWDASVDDFKLTWETSQHPSLFKIRNIHDKVMGENEQGFALGQILKVDPHFDLVQFIEEMEHYMFPIVLAAYLRGKPRDQMMLNGASEGLANSKFQRDFQFRAERLLQPDSAILDIAGVDLERAELVQGVPALFVSCVCQQIGCTRKYKTAELMRLGGTPEEIVDGHSSRIVSTRYLFMVKRDFINPDFDWKIVDFHHFVVQELTA